MAKGNNTNAIALSTNAANARVSTGPITPEGKSAIRFNALKTGLFARTVVLPHEDQPAYEALGAHLTAKWDPQTEDEREVILTIQNTTWRLNRAVQLETSLYAIGALQHLEATTEKFGDQPPAALYSLAEGAAYLANPRAFDQINRQEGRLQRALDRAKRELISLISLRHPAPEPVAQPHATEPSGFVRRNIRSTCPTSPGLKEKSIAANGCAKTASQIWHKRLHSRIRRAANTRTAPRPLQ